MSPPSGDSRQRHRSGRWYGFFAGGVGVVLVTLALVAVIVRGDSGQPFCQKVAVPAYIDPTVAKASGDEFGELVSHPETVELVVLDPDNGPGSSPNQPYRDSIERARRAGVAVYGYVDSGYAKRPVDEALTDIGRWGNWYGVRNIFFDQVTSSEASLDYYRPLAARVHDQRGKVVFNPGIYPAEDYAHLADITVTFEGSYADYRTLKEPAWAEGIPPERFWHLVYGTPEQDYKDALALTRDRGAGYAYVTDATLPNPWDSLPPYWGAEVRDVAATDANCS